MAKIRPTPLRPQILEMLACGSMSTAEMNHELRLSGGVVQSTCRALEKSGAIVRAGEGHSGGKPTIIWRLAEKKVA